MYKQCVRLPAFFDPGFFFVELQPCIKTRQPDRVPICFGTRIRILQGPPGVGKIAGVRIGLPRKIGPGELPYSKNITIWAGSTMARRSMETTLKNRINGMPTSKNISDPHFFNRHNFPNYMWTGPVFPGRPGSRNLDRACIKKGFNSFGAGPQIDRLMR